MSTTYTGLAGNVSLAAAVQITIPQDGIETESVASVNTPMQKSADYLQALHELTSCAILTFVLNPGNTANTTYWAWVGATQGAQVANPTTDNGVGQSRLLIPFSGRCQGARFRTGQTTAGNPVTVQINNITGSTLASLVVSTGTVAGTLISNIGAILGITAGDLISVQINNAVGVTASIGLCAFSLYIGGF